jgi:hypothetical protein
MLPKLFEMSNVIVASFPNFPVNVAMLRNLEDTHCDVTEEKEKQRGEESEAADDSSKSSLMTHQEPNEGPYHFLKQFTTFH